MILRLSISHKLMLALLGLTLVVLIATLGLARWSFERGFLDYVNALEQTRLTNISSNVASLYVSNGNTWEGVDTESLKRLIFQSPKLGSERGFGGPPPRGGGRRRPPNGERRGPPPRPKGGADRSFPPGFGGPKARKGPPLGRGIPPTVLFDLQDKRMVGIGFIPTDTDSIEVPIVVDGQTVALLKSEPKRKFDSSIETAFSRQQWITSGVIGIASLLLAALVSWGLVGILLSPVRRMIEGVNRLSRGDYSQTLQENRHDEFGQLMGDINHLTKTLDKNQSSRRRWIADISHELRTPLAVLVGEVEALKDGIRPFNAEQLESLDQEIQRLRHLTNDLYELSVSDIGGLRYEFAEMDLAHGLQQVIKSHELSAEEKDIELTLRGEKSVIISADSKRINQLLANLIRNSLAYTDAGGQVAFNLQLKQRCVVLSVDDSLPGVAQDVCLKIFEPLYRQDTSRARRGSGAGLGLAICQNIVEAHRGTIVAKPSPLGGLQIIIELPLDAKGIS